MLSQLLGWRVRDEGGRTARLADLAVRLDGEDYPPVTHLMTAERPGRRVLPWRLAAAPGPAACLPVPDLTAGVPAAEWGEPVVWLRAHVLDALLVDLQHRRVARASDLALAADANAPGRLRLCGADVGVRAMLRRLTGGRAAGVNQAGLLDWKYVEFLRGDPAAVHAGALYHRRLERVPPGALARLCDLLPYLHAAELVALLPDQLAADTLESASPERQLQVFEELSDDHAARLLAHLAPDVGADLIGRLPADLAQRVLNRVDRRHGERIIELLRYPADTVGGIMTNDVVAVPAGLTVGEARRQLRERLREPDFVYFLYVVEDEASRRLLGVVSLRDFVIAGDEATLKSLMNPYLITLGPLDTPRRAADLLLNSQLAALPVVGAEGQLLGAVTMDAAVAQLAPRAWREQAPRVFS